MNHIKYLFKCFPKIYTIFISLLMIYLEINNFIKHLSIDYENWKK